MNFNPDSDGPPPTKRTRLLEGYPNQTVDSHIRLQHDWTTLPSKSHDGSISTHNNRHTLNHVPASTATIDRSKSLSFIDYDTEVGFADAPAEVTNQHLNPNTLSSLKRRVPSHMSIPSSEICLGMFRVIAVEPEKSFSLPRTGSSEFMVNVTDSDIYSLPPPDGTRCRIGSINDERARRVISQLQNQTGISMEYIWHKCLFSRSTRKGKRAPGANFELLVNVYGRLSVAHNVGISLGLTGMYLQDPILCYKNVPYINPQSLGESEDTVMTSTFSNRTQTEGFTAPENILDHLLQTERLPEVETPKSVRTELHSHQKQGLYFMQAKEAGSTHLASAVESPAAPEIWFSNDSDQNSCFSKCGSSRSGLIADQMGLGKTLQMISLIASDKQNNLVVESQSGDLVRNHGHLSCITLVIVPVNLLQTWRDQLERHLLPHTLNSYIYHSRDRNLSKLVRAKVDIVLTTYDVVVADFRRFKSDHESNTIFSGKWRRIILDEAHYIKNSETLRARAVCKIQASFRWAVTGTPIQNRLIDLFSLISFLKVEPYDKYEVFASEILNPWKTRADLSAVNKLKALVNDIAIRRSKNSIALPTREDLIKRLTFNAAEKEFYEEMRLHTKNTIFTNRYSSHGNESTNVLRWIETLRMFCSSGAPVAEGRGPDQSATVYLQDTFNLQGSQVSSNDAKDDSQNTIESMLGFQMLVDEFSTEEQGYEMPLDHNSHASSTETDALNAPDRLHPSYSHLSEDVSTNQSSASSAGRSSPGDFQPDTDTVILPSSKIEALLMDLVSHTGKSLVFSFWHVTLDKISIVLENADISFLRLDGTMKQAERNSSIQKFRTQSNIKVLLATISVGAVGLDLTVATQVCLLEPQWNPTIEEQALSRVHRMGQTKPVTTIRYVMRDSIEENILELQKRKLRLAALALSGEQVNVESAYLEDLKLLLS